MLDELGYAPFQKTVQRLIGVDLASYRQGQMERRLDALVQRVGAKGFAEYAKMLERDPARLQEFRDYFTINVTEFFRDSTASAIWRRRYSRSCWRSRSALKVWSAACSIGAEPYSVAILLKELAPTLSHKILATDVDVTIVDRARRADKYVQAELKNVTPARLQKAFAEAPDGTYTVRPEVRQLVDVKLHNLLTLAARAGLRPDPLPQRGDLLHGRGQGGALPSSRERAPAGRRAVRGRHRDGGVGAAAWADRRSGRRSTARKKWRRRGVRAAPTAGRRGALTEPAADEFKADQQTSTKEGQVPLLSCPAPDRTKANDPPPNPLPEGRGSHLPTVIPREASLRATRDLMLRCRAA